MTNIQYHGKVYRSKVVGRLFTKTPNGNVLYKHPVFGPFKWSVSDLDVKTIDHCIKTGHLVEVNEK
ncbi:hypothetical protein [Aeromonas phage PZL-Ah8]|uniref:Uncharacterized protein n=1 Tax=Aeromonas phage PZL-Ah8 TaxID=2870529 RepID=A0AAE9BML4_9CAUD|nr:hypothetical protein [Aeromonas phage PZL-Ah8]